MRIVLIGAGNLATNLGKALQQAGHQIIQVYSRTIESAESLAKLLNAEAVQAIPQVVQDADIYIVAVKDCVLESIIHTLCKGREEAVFVHTAGSMPMDIFKNDAKHFGVLYPMQTFSKAREVDFEEIPCFIEYNDKTAENTISQLVNSISKNVYELSSENRKFLHLAAVFACNFSNHCYTMAKDILENANIPFKVMIPLIDETTRKIHQMDPVKAQTGPAIRYDENVINKHLKMLEDHKFMKELYKEMSESIHNRSQHD